MTKGDAMGMLINLTAEATSAGANGERFMSYFNILDRLNLESIQTEGQLLDAIDNSKPKWKSLCPKK